MRFREVGCVQSSILCHRGPNVPPFQVPRPSPPQRGCHSARPAGRWQGDGNPSSGLGVAEWVWWPQSSVVDFVSKTQIDHPLRLQLTAVCPSSPCPARGIPHPAADTDVQLWASTSCSGWGPRAGPAVAACSLRSLCPVARC